MTRGFLLVLALVAACTEKSRTTDTWSRTLPTARARGAFLCSYQLCPTPPVDAAFRVLYQDNSTGLLPAPSDGSTFAVVKISPDDAERWARGCWPATLDVRPDWVPELLADRPEWTPKSVPDMYRCPFGQERVIYVKEGVVFWQVIRN